jgi:hypothetical protein
MTAPAPIKLVVGDDWEFPFTFKDANGLTIDLGGFAVGGDIPIGDKGAFVDLASVQTISGAKTFSASPIVPTPTTGDNATNAASTAFVNAQNYLAANQSITLSGDVTGSGATAISATLANSGVTAGKYTKLTVDAKGRATSGATLAAADIPTLTAAKIRDFDTQVRTSHLDQMAPPTVDVSFNSRKIKSLADPAAA